MARNPEVSRKDSFPDQLASEVVERKGMGHPDTLADGIAERISVEYSRYCLDNFGAVLHHNVDKIAVLGGLTRVDWGSREILEPLRIVLNGRMSASFDSEEIPVREIQEEAAKAHLRQYLPRLDTETSLRFIDETTSSSRNPYWFNPRSLDDVPDHERPFANDTSAVIGYWPPSPLEQLAVRLEGYFYDDTNRPKFEHIGQDIKVMAIRHGRDIDVTMCVPFNADHLPDYQTYQELLGDVTGDLQTLADRHMPEHRVNLHVNTEDQMVNDTENTRGFYFTATGSATDYGEEGVVGRGNNRRGVIPSTRPFSMEAACGKNPVYHVGKVHGLIADTLAEEIVGRVGGQAEIWLVTRNGDEFYDPHNMVVNTSVDASPQTINEVIDEVLSRRDWTDRLVRDGEMIPRPNAHLPNGQS